MPRLFTGLEIPSNAATELSLLRGGLSGARWIEPEDYHLTLRFVGDVARRDQVGADALRERPHAALESVTEEGEAEPRALALQRLGDPPRDAALVRHADDERPLPRKRRHAGLSQPAAGDATRASG